MQQEQWLVSQKPITYIDEFLDLHKDIISLGSNNILDSKININKKRTNEKIKTIVQIAQPSDAQEIANIFRELGLATSSR